MAPPGDDTVKLDVSEATEVSAKAIAGDSKTLEEYELEVVQPTHLVELTSTT